MRTATRSSPLSFRNYVAGNLFAGFARLICGRHAVKDAAAIEHVLL
jgi:hypothetical protein